VVTLDSIILGSQKPLTSRSKSLMATANCENCGKEVDEMQIDRWGECSACRAADRASDMCVGDLNSK